LWARLLAEPAEVESASDPEEDGGEHAEEEAA
jgi:hypothetical protein